MRWHVGYSLPLGFILGITLLGTGLVDIGPAAAGEQDFGAARDEMVREQVEDRGIHHPATLTAMRSVPRHLFVPPDQVPYAYQDRPLPIGYGQTISQPYIVAYMTEAVRPEAGRKILEIGTGSGYQAAVLAEAGAEVFTVEIVPDLAESAAARLRELGYTRVKTRKGDGFYGWKEHAPYAAIVVTAAAEFIPPPLLEQLADGGRMIIPVGNPFFVQTLVEVERRGDEIFTRNLLPVRFVPLRRSE